MKYILLSSTLLISACSTPATVQTCPIMPYDAQVRTQEDMCKELKKNEQQNARAMKDLNCELFLLR